MDKKTCYKEDSLQDFAAWAKSCGHYPVAPLIQNYQEYVCHARNGGSEATPVGGSSSENTKNPRTPV